MGPVAFIIVFMLVPLAAAVFAGGFFAAVGLLRLLKLVPTGAWAALTVATGVVLAARLCVVVRGLNGGRPGVVRCEAPLLHRRGPTLWRSLGLGPQAGRRSRQEQR